MDLTNSQDYYDYYEKMRYQLTLRINIIFTFLLFCLGTTFYILEQPASFMTLSGGFICIIFLGILWFTKKYKLVALLFCLVGILMSIYTLIFIINAYHFADLLWMIIISLFTYFTLGKNIGHASIVIQFLAVVYYVIFNLRDNLAKTPTMADGQIYGLAINCFACALIIALLIHQFLKRNDFAADQYRQLTHELQKKNDLVEDQNREKTAMLKEIHHRVKNNLQVITSLLRLQSRDIENAAAVYHFNEAIDRIGAMALIHNQMYQSKDLDRIELEPYLESLSKNILNSYSLNIPVKMEFDISLKHTPSNIIVPLALLFNELITNSIKHAFSNREEGKIKVKVVGDLKDKIDMCYEDNGDWKPPEKEDSFGLELIDILAQQLNGTVLRTTHSGTRYEFILQYEQI